MNDVLVQINEVLQRYKREKGKGAAALAIGELDAAEVICDIKALYGTAPDLKTVTRVLGVPIFQHNAQRGLLCLSVVQ